MPRSDPAARRAYKTEWERRKRAQKPENYREATREWNRRNPISNRMRCARRRARKLNQFVEDVDAVEVLIRDAGVCGICGSNVDPDYHIDHIIPLAKGGVHGYGNVQLAHAICNMRKGDRG